MRQLSCKEIRKLLGLSQSQFAKAFSISVKTIQIWEQGYRNPSTSVQSYFKVIQEIPYDVMKIHQNIKEITEISKNITQPIIYELAKVYMENAPEITTEQALELAKKNTRI